MTTTATSSNNTPATPKYLGPKWTHDIDPQTQIDIAEEKSYNINVKPHQDKVDEYTQKLADISDLEIKAAAVSASLKSLRGTHRPADISVFDQSTIIASTSDQSVNIANFQSYIKNHKAAFSGEVELIVTELAQTDTKSSRTFSAAETVGTDGALVLGDNTGTASITVTSDMTLSDLKEAINAQSNTTNVHAELLDLDGTKTDYVLQLAHLKTGKAISFDTGSTASVLSALNFPEESDEDGLKAKLTVNGQPITRDDNSFEDEAGAYAVAFKQTGQARLTIAQDIEGISDSIKTFITTYNDFTDKLAEYTHRDGDEPENNGSLLTRSSFTSMDDKLRATLGKYVEGLGTEKMSSLWQAGISWDETGALEIKDTEKYVEALTKNTEQLRRFFEFHAPTSNSDFFMSSSPNELSSDLAGKNIAVTYNNDSGGTKTATFDDGVDQVTVNISPDNENTISGTGKFAGFYIFYSGVIPEPGNSVSTTFSSVTQGALGRLSNLFDTFLMEGNDDLPKGTFQAEKDQLLKQKSDAENRIEQGKTSVNDEIATLKSRIAVTTARIEQSRRANDNLDAMRAQMYAGAGG